MFKHTFDPGCTNDVRALWKQREYCRFVNKGEEYCIVVFSSLILQVNETMKLGLRPGIMHIDVFSERKFYKYTSLITEVCKVYL